MTYVLLNRQGIVVDVLNEIRYIKLQSTNGYIIGCSEEDATGVIGSDQDTAYTLIKSDTTSSPNAVRIMELEEISSNVVPGYYKFDTETQSIVYRYTLDEAKDQKQSQNKTLFAEYLAAHPLTWTDGKQYGVTLEDQSEISLNLNQYQIALNAGIESPTLEWHAIHEECAPWTLENLVALSTSISEAVYPIYHLMQEYKTAIYGASTIEEVEAVELKYADADSVDTTA